MKFTKKFVMVKDVSHWGYVHPLLPGMVIHRAKRGSNRGWILVHIESGGVHLGVLNSVVVAKRAMENLFAAGIDWTLDANELVRTHQNVTTILHVAIQEAKLGSRRQKVLFDKQVGLMFKPLGDYTYSEF